MVYLSVRYDIIDGEEDIVDVLPGLYTLNDNGDEDVMFKDGEDVFWLSDIENYDLIDNTGLWNLVRKVIKKVVESPAVKNVVNTIATAVAPIIRFCVTSFYISGFGPLAAWIGGTVLDMYQEWKPSLLGIYVPSGIYHAKFNCWQKEVGYDDFYDEVFDNGTGILGRKRMERHKYAIDVDGDKINDYILWAWKGDYYNLGAGCELGIYERVKDDKYGLVWKCAQSRAFNCKVQLKYNNTSLIDWDNNGNKHWWFTGFNSNFQFPLLDDINKLTATFEITFNSFNTQSENDNFYNCFYKSWDENHTATMLDWKYWATNKNENVYSNGIKCHIATLSF